MKQYQKRNRRCFAGALVSIFISTIFAVSLQFFKGSVLDHAVAGDIGKTVRSALLLIGFILCEVLFYFGYKQFSARFVAGCTKDLKHDIFAGILNRSYAAYKERPQGEYIAKYTNEADTIKERQFAMLPVFWEILFKIMFVSAALFILDWRIAVITIVLLTTPLYLPKIIEKPLQNTQAAYIHAVEDTLAKINDWLSGFEVIKNYAIERKIIDRFQSANNRAMDAMLRDASLGAVAQLITTLISYLSYFIVLGCAAWLVLEGDFSAGDFFIAIGMIDQLSYPLISLAGIIRQLIAVRPACDAMEHFLKVPQTPQTAGGWKTVQSAIQYKNVTFAYADRRAVLQNFNLTIQKGKHYLLKGPSGCGKTTVINLLLRYYNITKGSIEIDGVPLEKAGNPYEWITVVRQEATLFHDTLRNNLTMYQDMPEQRLLDVLNSVGLEKYANRHALDSLITEQGTNFSGGEKKRICLARALLRETDVLILDEPLANLDSATAGRIEDLLLSMQGRTLLIVTHQFSESKLNRFEQVLDFANS